MPRKGSGFDPVTTNRELEAIPYPDRGALYQAMTAYAEELGVRHVVKNYGEGLMMLKASNGTSGRCLFVQMVLSAERTKLVALLVYKKESGEAPKHIVEAARARMRDYLRSREEEQ